MDDSARSIGPMKPGELLAEAGWLRRLARRLTADPEEARELEQDTWHAALARPPRATGSPRPWLQAVAKNLWRRRLRDAAARADHEDDAARHERADLAHREGCAAPLESEDAELATLARLELQAQVVAAVRALREPYRTAVTLRYLDGLAYDEVARRTATSEVAARKRVSRGLEELRRRLDRTYGGRAAWGALAFALGRDLPVPPSVAAAGLAGSGTATSVAAVWTAIGGIGAAIGSVVRGGIAGGATMTMGAKVGGAALAAAALGMSLWWVARPMGRGVSHPGGAAAPEGTKLVAADAPPVTPVGLAAERRTVEATADRDAAAPLATPADVAGRIAGVVRGPDGAPLAGARVLLARGGGSEYGLLDLDYRRRTVVLAGVRTDGEGRFAFEAEEGRRYALQAAFDELCEARREHVFAGDELELALTAAASVFGFVSRADGLPAIGADVLLRRAGRHAGERRQGASDHAGLYRFTGLEAGPYVLEVTSDEGATPDWTTVDVAAGEERRVDVALGAGTLVRGRVTDALTGAPIAGAEVSESWVFEKLVRTDANGEFRYPDYPREGYVDLCARAQGYGGVTVQIRGYFDQRPRAEHWEIALPPAVSVRGRVVDAAGAPLEDVYVCACASVRDANDVQQTDWRGARTGADGRYAIDGVRPDLPHALFAQKDGYGTAVFEFGTPVAHVELGDVVLQPGALVHGRVVGDGGEPLAHERVVLHGANDGRAERFGHPLSPGLDSYVSEREARTDDRGRFRFADVAAGDYRVEARLERTRAGAERAVRVEAGEVVDAGRLEIALGLVIEGIVLGPEGRALGGVFVRARGESESVPGDASAVAGADGSFRFAGLSPGTYALEAFPFAAEGGLPLARMELAGIPAGATGVELRLAHAAVLRGRVVDAAGAPVERATVRMEVPNGPDGWTQTDPGGAFELHPPSGARVTLRASPPRADADPNRPFQFDPDPAREARLADVPADGPAVTLVLPAGG